VVALKKAPISFINVADSRLHVMVVISALGFSLTPVARGKEERYASI